MTPKTNANPLDSRIARDKTTTPKQYAFEAGLDRTKRDAPVLSQPARKDFGGGGDYGGYGGASSQKGYGAGSASQKSYVASTSPYGSSALGNANDWSQKRAEPGPSSTKLPVLGAIGSTSSGGGQYANQTRYVPSNSSNAGLSNSQYGRRGGGGAASTTTTGNAGGGGYQPSSSTNGGGYGRRGKATVAAPAAKFGAIGRTDWSSKYGK